VAVCQSHVTDRSDNDTDRYSRNDGPSSGVLTPESSAVKLWLMAAALLGGVTLELHAELYELNDEPYDAARFLRD